MLKRNQKFGRCHKTASGHHKVEIYALYAEKRISRHKTASGHHKVEEYSVDIIHVPIERLSQNRKRSLQGRVLNVFIELNVCGDGHKTASSHHKVEKRKDVLL